MLGHPPRDPVAVHGEPRSGVGGPAAPHWTPPAQLLGHPLHYFLFPDLPPLDTPEGGRRLALTATEYEPRLIILDTISRLVEGKEDSADTWRNLYNHNMIPLRRQCRTVLRLDNQGHDASKGARGCGQSAMTLTWPRS